MAHLYASNFVKKYPVETGTTGVLLVGSIGVGKTPAGVHTGSSSVSVLRGPVRQETLGDRIGERMRLRLQQMCVPLELQGEDFRQSGSRPEYA